jgi:hypothetical protein
MLHKMSARSGAEIEAIAQKKGGVGRRNAGAWWWSNALTQVAELPDVR